MATELKPPEFDEPQLRQKLEPELRQMDGPVTLGDVVTATGLPAERTEPVLRELLDEYQGRLAVDERGELIYEFPRGLRRPRTKRELLREVARWLWRAFKVVYKAGILVILVVYFLIFVAITLALMAAILSRGGDSDFDFDLDLDGCGDGCGDGCLWAWILSDNRSYHTTTQPFQRRGPTPYRTKAPGAKSKVPPWELAYEFVFGREAAAVDPLEDERRVLAYLRDHSGRITAADVVALTGCTLDEADGRLLNLMVRHGGDVDVSDEGSLIYTFDRLMISAGRRPGESETNRTWTWWWERTEQPEPLNRNSSTANWTIGAINFFNLVWSSIFVFGGQALVPAIPAAAWWFLGPVAWVFSLLFFVIPAVRKVILNRENAARKQRNRLRELGRAVLRHYAGLGGHEVTADLLDPAAAARYEGVSDALNQELLEDLARRWQAELEFDDEGHTGYRFARLRQELADVARARRDVDPDQFRLGAIEYDSEA